MAKIVLHDIGGDHYLYINGHLWMYNLGEEKKMQKKISDQAYGEVLVVGYGLGIVHQFLKENPNVRSITTVEKYQKVIDINTEVYDLVYGEVIIADFHRYTSEKKFDCVIGDIWEDIDEQYLPKYNRFKKRAQKFLKPGGKMLAWGKNYFEFLNQNPGWSPDSAT